MSNEETTGEDFIADFLDEKVIKFKRYPKIEGLSDDDRFFREADFYLQEYKVYVEFLGQWQNPEHQKRYRQKMAVYAKNRIPCVYLWPDNLGTLEWILNRRIKEVLLKYNKKFLLLKLLWHEYMKKRGLGILLFIGLAAYTWDSNWRLLFIGGIVFDILQEVFQQVKRISKLKKSKWASEADYTTRK